MQFITVELLNENALKLLQQLEKLKILRLVVVRKKPNDESPRKWAGSLSKETAQRMLDNIQHSRNQWERDI